MNKREAVQALMDSVQKGDFEFAKSMLADDFQFSGNKLGEISDAIRKRVQTPRCIGE